MIRSKIEARERALELAVKTFETSKSFSSKSFMEWVSLFEKYLIGDADLPEMVDDNAHLKELFAVAQREMEKINKRDDDYLHNVEKSFVGRVREYNPEEIEKVKPE